jgi:hypothetical protein
MRDHNTDNLNDPMDAYIRQGLKTLFSENFPPDARLDAFKQPWFLAFHSSLSVMRHLP